MRGAPSTLRSRLLLAGGLGVLLVSAVASWMLGSVFEIASRRALDRQLEEDLISLLALVEADEQGRLQLRHAPDDQRYSRIFSGAYWQVLDLQGVSLLQSRSLWDESLLLPRSVEHDGAHGYDLRGPAKQSLRGLVREVTLPRGKVPLQFVVAVDRSHVDQDVSLFRRLAAAALAGLTALWLAVLVTQVHYGLKPLAQLSATAARVRAGDRERFHEQGLPGEILPLVEHLNQLLDHHRRMVERARTSAGDLAHALKTPLAVLISVGERPPGNWQATLLEQTVRMNGSIERYLAAGVAVNAHQRTHVLPVATALATLLQRVHGERGVRVDLAGCDDIEVPVAQEDLEEMLGNILDNACRWADAQVTLRASRTASEVIIDIIDDGPGIPEGKLQAVMARGVRLDERPSSSGLGLAIVMDIAVSYGGWLMLKNLPDGLQATLRFSTDT